MVSSTARKVIGMGEAKRRRGNRVPVVYHHTSTLRTNLIWMAGEIDVEGNSKGAYHPQLGEISINILKRRALRDFPPLVWLTKRIDVPNVLLTIMVMATSKETGEVAKHVIDRDQANAYALNRVALGFPIASIPELTPWPDHYGYTTPEGHELNASARYVGDAPDDWFVCETPIDVLKVSEFWASSSMMKPKLRRRDGYIRDIHRMVTLRREREGVYIPPSWLTPEQAQNLVRTVGMSMAKMG
jgi:hypothetical protein